MKKHLFLLALSFQLRLSTQYQTKEEYDQDTAGLKKIGMCRNWHKANKHTFVEECQPTCGDAKEHSVLCFDISSDGSTKDWHTSYDGEKYTLGHCKCDVAIAEKIVGQYVLWLPVVAEIGCFIFLKTLSWIGELVVNAAIDAIPGGAAVNGALKMVIQAAKTFASNGLPADPFKAWILDTCDVDPNEKWVKDIGGIFDALSGSVVPGIEGVPCKKCPGGKNDNHDIDKDKDKDRGKPTGGPKDPKPTHNDHGQTSRKDEQHKPTPTSDEHKSVAQTSKGSPQSTARSSNPPKSSAVSTAQTPKSSLQSTARSSDPPKSSAASDKIPSDQARTKTDTPASMTATPTSASACALGKRDGQNVRDQNVRYFEDGRNTFFDGCTLHVTTTTKKDWGALTTPAVTCSARWSQACYHYRSVMSVQGALGKTDYVRWTCGATASSFDGRATRLYSTSSLVVKKNENGGVPFFSVPDKLNQHHFGWIDRWVEAGYTTTNYVGGCDRDEWPPRNFWPESKKAKEGQFIRLLPAGENRGAGSMWNGFCKMNSDWKHWLRKDHLSNEKDNDRIRTTNSMVVENIKDGRTSKYLTLNPRRCKV
ncbi:hypothetical protein EJ05DRAFT_114208 [Pseudovirgaria hyperparasitica]|uniref:Cyanovirin-N domain-containing protein n=1 Tax=Pseudovirgaria hyperparasitica TaxID=470096 RepID=A0A6A6W2C8_9PEZI|nr:uncharacterized protein EJ05DRAFT_114208 [Pseudovirgaria hyperparasitica]KAF2755747.1 hypothetical protein EJ05DRAFT_114208 [Pseudovirgaria hyperparasitica]